ncbi:MAG: tRNA (guanosine(46)-N7)-methyltransferase TrmB [Pseudomonadota bacterium]
MALAHPQRTYGRTKARALKPRQAALVDALLPHLAVPAEGEIDVEALFNAPPLPCGEGAGGEGPSNDLSPGRLLRPSPAGLWPAPSPQGRGLVFEIGFGGGEHLVAQAQAHPDYRFIGVEPFLNGVGSCLRHIEESGAQNIRLHHGDARDVLARLPDASLDRIYILFPDPWPKTRHWKRRLIQADFIAELARVLKADGAVRFATDWKNYAAWTLEFFLKDLHFRWSAERAADWRDPWPDHVTTRYQEKRLGDCSPIFLEFIRV